MSEYIHTYIEFDDDGNGCECSEDATAFVEQSLRELVEKKKQVSALQQELSDIKSRRYWDELGMVTDKRTGMAAVVRTTYRWQAETLRLDFSNEMYKGVGYPG